MRIRSQYTAVILTILPLVLGGCGALRGGPAGATNIELPGVYRFVYEDDGDEFGGTATIVGTPGAYGGEVRFEDGRPDLAISSATSSGNLVVMTADVPGAVLLMRLHFEGDAFTGDWVLGSGAGRVRGTRSEVGS